MDSTNQAKDPDGMCLAVRKLRDIKAKRILVQFPEGLKMSIQGIVDALESEGYECITSLQECFGACDLRDDEARRLRCDAILHIGHEDFGVKGSVPAIFWPYAIEADPIRALGNKEEFEKISKFARIGIVSSIQFSGALAKAKAFLESKGVDVFVHKSLAADGQILGCRLDAATEIDGDVDAFLCISAGKFYGLGLAMKTGKPCFSLDLEKGTITDLSEEKRRMEKIVAWNVSGFMEAKVVAILVSWKRGQMKDPVAVRSLLEGMGKKVYVFAMDETTPDKLLGLRIDAAVNLACPRIGMDDISRFKIPIINPDQVPGL
jgi:2-(3-amino-3-carboxypropyl)histidine synthase